MALAVTVAGAALAQSEAPQQTPAQTQQPPAQTTPQQPPAQASPTTNFQTSPIGPGFWAFPGQRDANVDASCRTGFTIRFANGRSVSMVIEQRRQGRFTGRPPRVLVDSSDTCTFDQAAQVERCTGRLAERGRVGTLASETRFEQDGDRVRAVTTSTLSRRNGRRETLNPVTTYPTQCPDTAVHEALTAASPAP